MVHSDGKIIIYKGYLWPQELKYCRYFWPNIIFIDHILLNFCTCDRILHSLYLAYIVSVVSRFTCNIIVQVKYELLEEPWNIHKHDTIRVGKFCSDIFWIKYKTYGSNSCWIWSKGGSGIWGSDVKELRGYRRVFDDWDVIYTGATPQVEEYVYTRAYQEVKGQT